MQQDTFRAAIAGYQSHDTEEAAYQQRFMALLNDTDHNPYVRERLAGHLTASAWVVNPGRSHVLLILHRKLNRWLQPGGHADGDTDLLAVARKELEEETGLTDYRTLSTGIFDLDIHTIPERKGVPEHDHYDVRFCFEARMDAPLNMNHEIKEITWCPLHELRDDPATESSIGRMVMKTLEDGK